MKALKKRVLTRGPGAQEHPALAPLGLLTPFWPPVPIYLFTGFSTQPNPTRLGHASLAASSRLSGLVAPAFAFTLQAQTHPLSHAPFPLFFPPPPGKPLTVNSLSAIPNQMPPGRAVLASSPAWGLSRGVSRGAWDRAKETAAASQEGRSFYLGPPRGSAD